MLRPSATQRRFPNHRSNGMDAVHIKRSSTTPSNGRLTDDADESDRRNSHNAAMDIELVEYTSPQITGTTSKHHPHQHQHQPQRGNNNDDIDVRVVSVVPMPRPVRGMGNRRGSSFADNGSRERLRVSMRAAKQPPCVRSIYNGVRHVGTPPACAVLSIGHR